MLDSEFWSLIETARSAVDDSSKIKAVSEAMTALLITLGPEKVLTFKIFFESVLQPPIRGTLKSISDTLLKKIGSVTVGITVNVE